MIPLFSCFLPPESLGPALVNGRIISGDTFINPADIPSSLLFLGLEGALASSVM
jgi:hypothetical protein